MYNFRYLLVTIVSIFVSLAIGLLLGAAIAGSDLVRDTSQDMLDSLMSRFDDINTTNLDLRRQLDDDNLLTTQFVNDWTDKRLDGRTIIIISSADEDDAATVENIRATVERAGGATVLVKVLKNNFGLDEVKLRTNMEKTAPPVQNEDYVQTIAHALADEWSYQYEETALDAPTAADNNIGAKAATPFQTTIYNHYRLTTYLAEQGVIQITTNYHLLSNHQDPQLQNEQLMALRVAGTWQLPYAANAVINTFVQVQASPLEGDAASDLPSEIVYSSDPVALALTNDFVARGAKESLPYPMPLRPDLANENPAISENDSYFGLLVQVGDKAQTFITSARDRSLPCLISLEGETDIYNLLALLTGAKRGIYGLNAPEGRFPALPNDNNGKLPFSRPAD